MYFLSFSLSSFSRFFLSPIHYLHLSLRKIIIFPYMYSTIPSPPYPGYGIYHCHVSHDGRDSPFPFSLLLPLFLSYIFPSPLPSFASILCPFSLPLYLFLSISILSSLTKDIPSLSLFCIPSLLPLYTSFPCPKVIKRLQSLYICMFPPSHSSLCRFLLPLEALFLISNFLHFFIFIGKSDQN